MDTRAAATLIHLRVTVGRLEALWTLAVKSVLLIHTRSSIPTGAGCTLVYFHITFGTSEARFADTVVAVDAVFADAVIARITGTIVKVYLTVCARGSMLALANVFVDQVHTFTAILTGVAVAFI